LIFIILVPNKDHIGPGTQMTYIPAINAFLRMLGETKAKIRIVEIFKMMGKGFTLNQAKSTISNLDVSKKRE
jgi:hypothetical protein